jgi:hypothetical protein
MVECAAVTLGGARTILLCSVVLLPASQLAGGSVGCRGRSSAAHPPAVSDTETDARLPVTASAKDFAPEQGDYVAQVTVYARGAELIVVPGVGHGGYYRDVAPVLIVKPSALDLQVAIDQARRSVDRREPGRGSSWVVQERLHLDSVESFYRDVACCIVAFDRQGHATVQMDRPAPDGRGFEPAGAELSVADQATLGQTVIDALAKTPRFPK